LSEATPQELLTVHIDAGTTLIWVQTHEETVLQDFIVAGARARLMSGMSECVWSWSLTAGLSLLMNPTLGNSVDETLIKPMTAAGASLALDKDGKLKDSVVDLVRVLRGVREHVRIGGIDGENVELGKVTHTWVIYDAAQFLLSNNPYPLQRVLRDVAALSQDSRCTHRIVLVDATYDPPARMDKIISYIQWPLPSRTEVGILVDRIAASRELKNSADNRTAMVDALLGLTAYEIDRVCLTSVAMHNTLSPRTALLEKAEIIRKSGVLRFYANEGGMEKIGGLGNMKRWLNTRRNAFSQRAKDFGLSPPKGMILGGVPGTGKSLTAKCIGASWGIPVLHMDVGSLMGSHVGQSEGMLRKALAVADAVSPCVLFIDEGEKGFGGGGKETDGGTSGRMLQTFLTWMNDHTTDVFVLLTANKVWLLPPEFLRAGRFDAMFFVDVPTLSERVDILRVQLRNIKRDPTTFLGLSDVARAAEDYTGSELAQVVQNGLYDAFNAGEELSASHLIAAVKSVTPIMISMRDKISELRKWGAESALPASLVEEEVVQTTQSTAKFSPIRPVLNRQALQRKT